jgi:hypothetical protein
MEQQATRLRAQHLCVSAPLRAHLLLCWGEEEGQGYDKLSPNGWGCLRNTNCLGGFKEGVVEQGSRHPALDPVHFLFGPGGQEEEGYAGSSSA